MPIESVKPTDLVWDGEEFVSQQGPVCKGLKSTIRAHGVWMTPDHKVLTVKGWKDASQSERFDRAPCRIPNGYGICGVGRAPHAVEVPLLSMRRIRNPQFESARALQKGPQLSFVRLPQGQIDPRTKHSPRVEQAPNLGGMALHEGALRNSDGTSMEELRRSRHISVPEWSQSFEKFYEDMSPTYKKGLQLDRIDNNKGYSKENCRWVTPIVNCNNRRRSVVIDGKPLSQWSKETGIGLSTLHYRIKHNCPREHLFDKPDTTRSFSTLLSADQGTDSWSQVRLDR